MVWFSFQDFYVASLSLGDIPGAMARVRSGEQVRDVVTVLSGRIRTETSADGSSSGQSLMRGRKESRVAHTVPFEAGRTLDENR